MGGLGGAGLFMAGNNSSTGDGTQERPWLQEGWDSLCPAQEVESWWTRGLWCFVGGQRISEGFAFF